jgi:hypothetical protein
MDELKELLKSSWLNGVKNAYITGDLCSEKNLQAELYHQLKLTNWHKHYRFWVEPCLLFSDHHPELSYLKPDLLISCGNEIVGIVELKYKPQSECHFQYDLSKMRRFEVMSTNYALYLEIFYCTGSYSPQTFTVSPNLLSVFGVIARDFAHAVIPEKLVLITEGMPSRLLHLSGIIYGGMKEPIFSVQYFNNTQISV